MDNYIEIVHLNKVIKGHEILKDINMKFERGKVYALIGRNGSGKSMLLKTIAGLTPPTEGYVVVDGKVIGKDVDFPENMSCIIESPGYLAKESGFNNLKYLQNLTKKPDKKRIKEVLRLVGLENHMNKKVGKYSTGMKQRLGLAQVLMDDNDLVILDEPLNGLDNEGMKQFRDIFLSIKKQGKTMLIATHMPEDVEALCDYVTRMDNGVLSINEEF